MYIYIYIYIYILVTMHEDTMQTKRTRVRDAHRVETLFVLLLLSNGFSFASRSRQIETKLIGETAQSTQMRLEAHNRPPVGPII